MKTASERGENFKKKIKTIMNHSKKVREKLTFMKQEQGTIQKWEY